MLGHALGAIAAAALIVLLALLPFLPGSYDPLALPLSMMARVFGFVGLLLVPFGALWIARPRRAFALAALVASAVVWAAVTLAAFSFSGFTLGAATLLLGAWAAYRAARRLATASAAAAWYLVAVPLAVFLLQQALVGRAVEFSRNRAIRNAGPLIADIERYREVRGVYPPSLLAVWADYKPSIVGIERYHYEPSGAAYNLVFEQVALALPTREFVVYNPRDEQVMTSHPMDLLQYPPERLALTRGYFAVHATPHPHWKYFWFD